jgi:2',3'-cyclic-nucleotide 2'-phosphodiesterase (5'-nucleotidase family)
MKKLINVFIIFILLFVFASCEDKPDIGEDMSTTLNIYTVNDFHGAIFENGKNQELGISKIGQFLKSEKDKDPNNTIILSAGDMFQGTALSSMTRGEVVVDLMNHIGFDAMAIGNHEFDWGVEHIERYVDGDEENGEADFPFLGANIFHKPSNDYVDWAKPYTIISKGKLKIGVLGLIGEGLTSSILETISQDFEFTAIMDSIKKYVPIMRNEEGADIVIVVCHDDTRHLNNQIKNLAGDLYVDAIVNGHTHADYVFEETRGALPPFVGVQSNSNGKYVGHLMLDVDLQEKRVTDASAGFVGSSKLKNGLANFDDLLKDYQEYVDLEQEFLGYSASRVDKYAAARWAANVAATFDNADYGLINDGGIRTGVFPINSGESVTFGMAFRIMPFDNLIVTAEIKGSDVKRLAAISGLRFSSNYDSKSIIDGETYRVSVVDYVFYKYDFVFNKADNITYHEVLFRDLLVEDIRNSVSEHGKWYS